MASPTQATSNTVEADLILPLPTPHWGKQSRPAFTVKATTTIAASPDLILSTLLDTQTWPKWNNFVPRATLKPSPDSSLPHVLRPGILFTEHVDMYGHGKPSGLIKMKLLMTTLDDIRMDDRSGSRAVWLGKGYPDWALRSERVHEVYIKKGGKQEEVVYNVYETFSGPLAWVVRMLLGGVLVRRFAQWNAELKAFMERVD